MTQDQLLGSIIDEDGVAAVRVSDVYDASSEELWAAITRPERLANWIATVDGDLRVGGSFHAVFTSGWEGEGRVETCDPHHRLELTMNPGGEDQTTVEATLSPHGDRTRLVIEERGLPLAVAPGFAAGWQAHIEDLARSIADQNEQDATATAWQTRWSELSEPYSHLTPDA